MKHKYQIGSWICFVDYCAPAHLNIDEVCYLVEMDSHPVSTPGYVTRGGKRVQEREILEAREKGQS